MKYSKKIRGMSTALAFAFAFMVFSFSFAPKAYAADAAISVNIGFKAYMYNVATPTTRYYRNTVTTPANDVTTSVGANSEVGYYSDVSFSTVGDTEFSDVVKVYISYFFNGSKPSVCRVRGNYLDTSTFNVTYLNHNGQTGYVENGFELIEYNNAAGFNGKGYNIEAQFSGSEAYPIRNLSFERSSSSVGFDAGPGSSTYFTFPSIRIIATAYSAEMEALDNVANEIAAQSDILLAMKGDLVAILQDIYTMTGDMHIAQNLLNSYIVQMLPLLESIDQSTTNIYALLRSQLAALETAINTSASTIEAAIEAQTAAMIAYLEEMFNTGNEVPSETYEQQQDAENILDQMESLEKPDVETIVPEIDDYSDGGVSGVMSAIFSSNLIVTMMTLSASLAFGAYVLFGKRS